MNKENTSQILAKRRYVFVTDDNREIVLSFPQAYALEMSEYIIPTRSTQQEWRYRRHSNISEDDVLREIKNWRKG